jgi:prepilin-type processing-associated H-X9-DG protein
LISVYCCPSQKGGPSTTTNYMVVTGPGTPFDGAKATKMSEFTDGTGNTILLVEVADSHVRWAEPKDLPIQDLLAATRAGADGPPWGSLHPGGANVSFADASARFLNESLDADRLKAMLTIAGGEMTQPSDLE